MNFYRRDQWILTGDHREYMYLFLGFYIVIEFRHETVIRVIAYGNVPGIKVNEKLIIPLQWDVIVNMKLYPYSYGYRSWCYIYLNNKRSIIREVHILKKSIFFIHYNKSKPIFVVLPNNIIAEPFDNYSDYDFVWVIHLIIMESKVSNLSEYFYNGNNTNTYYDKEDPRCWDIFIPEDPEKLDQDIENFLDLYYTKDRRYKGYKMRRKLQKEQRLKEKLEKEKLEQERLEQERLEQERLDQEEFRQVFKDKI